MRSRFLIAGLVGLLATSAFARSPEKLATLLDGARSGPRTAAQLEAIDREAGQKDAVRSGLFWYTELHEAIAVATEQGKPILSLRLLGRLDEELSCANSRFFRKTLYVDPDVVRTLKERFVLHWESVRPVPLVTIDYGDGRKVTRTLTGNSIHYLLAPDGRVIDGLPGLMDAATFERELGAFATFVARDPKVTPAGRSAYHADRLHAIAATPAALPPPPPADRAMARSMAKLRVETRVLSAVRNPSAYVMQDTVKNQRELRPKLIGWLQATATPELDAINTRVYSELFDTPLNDLLMGLDLPDESALVASPIPSK